MLLTFCCKMSKMRRKRDDRRLRGIFSPIRCYHESQVKLLSSFTVLLVFGFFFSEVSAFLVPRFSIASNFKKALGSSAVRKLQHSLFQEKAFNFVLCSHLSVNGEASDAGVNEDIMSRNQLMHAMLRVPDVNATVEYWTSRRGANLHSYARTPKSETAFIGYGPDGPEGGYFSLEITALPRNETLVIGNAVRYFGLSMLLDFDIKSTVQSAAGNRKPAPQNDVDPNGITIRSVAAAPGDSFSRVCLGTRASSNGDDILSETSDFYVNLLGMKQVAGDDSCVCVRYSGKSDNDESSSNKRVGVSTTLVFELSQDFDLDYGNCFDHIAVSTPNVLAAEKAINTALYNDEEKVNSVIFMKPKAMFGTTIMGLQDPNGYKVYLVERPES